MVPIVLSALLWGLVGSSSLVIGASAGVLLQVPGRGLGLLLGFGAGALVSAISFELADEALAQGGPGALAAGLAAGGLLFYAGDRLLEHRTNTPRHARRATGGGALALGALLDGLPEQAAIGLSVAAGSGVGVSLVAAVFISNIPESLGSAADMRQSGTSAGAILRLWIGVGVVTTLASLAGYAILGDASGWTVGFTQAFAAGALIVMLVDAMVPEAHEKGGRIVGLATLLGYALAVLLSEVVA
jgi:ZIP family zinc transporter